MVRYLTLPVMLLAVLTNAKTENLNVLELLDNYKATRNKFRSFTSKSENSIEFDVKSYNPRFPSCHLKNFRREDFRFDGKRSNLRAYLWGEVLINLPIVPKNNPQYTSSLRTETRNRWYGRANLKNDPGRMTLDRSIQPENKLEMAVSRGYKGHEAIGYFYGDDERADVVMRRALNISVRDDMEEIGASKCYVIDAITKRGKYTVWIDPEHGYNIAKAEIMRKSGDIAFGINKTLEGGEQYYTQLSNVRFKQIDGVWVPVEADIKYRWKRPKMYDYKEDIHHKVTEFIINPDHDALGSFEWDDIQNGAEVEIVQVPGISYIWQDGELIPKIDEAVIGEIDKMTEEIMAETIRTKSTIAPMGATVSELLKKYAETQDKLRSFIAKGESTIEYIKIPRQSGRMQKELCEFRTDGDRVNHHGSVWDKLLSKDKALYKSFLWDGESFIQYRQGSQLTDSAVFIEKNDDSKKRMIATEYKGAPLMGICGGDYDRIDSILRKADNISLRQKTEQVGNSQCYVIDAVTKRGKYMVWIDPEHGYNIAKIELQKRKGDLIGSSERVEIGMLFLLKNVRFEKIDEVWVPVEADMKQYQDDQNRIIKWHHKRTKMTLNPDHNALGSFVPDDIPEGTKEKLLTVTY